MEKVVESTPTVISNAIEVTEGLTNLASSTDVAKNALSAVGAVGEAVKPFVPLISAVTLLISEIIVIYENAQYNKRICNSLMDRVGAAEQAVKSLQRRKAENEKHFKNVEYYKNFVRFVDVLKRIKGFIKDVSELQGYKKFFHANSIKEKFDSLVKEFEIVMGELHFTMAVADEEQRRIDHEALEQDIADMTKFLEQIKGGIVDNTNTLNTVLQEVLIMKGQIEHFSDLSKVNLPNSDSIKAVEINPAELLDPDIRKDSDHIKNLQQELKLIIISGLRASLQQIFLQLSKLANIYQKPLSSPALLPPKTLDLDGTMIKAPVSVSDEGGMELPDLGDEFNLDEIET
ncbi:14605_t:CDS:2, partial [Dentiscutata erythropus]